MISLILKQAPEMPQINEQQAESTREFKNSDILYLNEYHKIFKSREYTSNEVHRFFSQLKSQVQVKK
jgi:hypothetical protein